MALGPNLDSSVLRFFDFHGIVQVVGTSRFPSGFDSSNVADMRYLRARYRVLIALVVLPE